MIQKNKELLLKDLCVRLLYGVKCKDVTLNFVGTILDISMHDNMCKLFNDYGDNYTCFMMNCRRCNYKTWRRFSFWNKNTLY